MTEVVELFSFIIFSDCKEYKDSCNFSPQSCFVKGSYINFFFDYKEICLFQGYFEDILRIFDFSRIVWQDHKVFNNYKPSFIFPKQLHHRRLSWLLIRLCICKMTNQKLDALTPMSISTWKNGLIKTQRYFSVVIVLYLGCFTAGYQI